MAGHAHGDIVRLTQPLPTVAIALADGRRVRFVVSATDPLVMVGALSHCYLDEARSLDRMLGQEASGYSRIDILEDRGLLAALVLPPEHALAIHEYPVLLVVVFEGHRASLTTGPLE